MRRLALVVGWIALSSSPSAFAGGFEFPGNDTEALARGAAFTAKADDGMALDYNIAGLARQRGTRLLVGANLALHDYQLQRLGSYPGDTNDAKTPWANQPYPLVTNGGGPFLAPLIALSTDFNYFDRWTFAIGIFAPSAVGNRDYGLTVGRLPSPARYDLVSENLLILFPTLAAAVRVNRYWDLGLALHLAVASFDLQTASVLSLGDMACPPPQYQPCDVPTRLQTSGVTATAALGTMLHPTRAIDIGVNVRAPIELATSGTVSNPALDVGHNEDLHLPVQSGSARFNSHLPWVLKAGLRYRFLKDGFEAGDIELDGTYEAWALAEGDGDTLHIDQLGPFVKNVTASITRHYRDTFGARLGGAFNRRFSFGVLSLRAGVFYDSAATHYRDTRLDFDTMVKVAATIGGGIRFRGIGINLAYVYVWEPERDIQNGGLQAINGFDGSAVGPTVNDGIYRARTQLLSLSVSVNWEEALKKQRVIHYDP
jgi:long-subunit fatty acid transport protein